MKTVARKTLVATSAAVLSAALVVAFWPRGSMEQANFWDAVRLHGDEVEGFDSLTQMSASADAVAIGRFVDSSLRAVEGDAEEDVVTYVQLTFEPREVLRGRLTTDRVVVEFLVPEGSGEITDIRASFPRDDAILFLRTKKGPGESGLMRLVNSSGLWVESARGVEAPVWAEWTPDGSRPYEQEVVEFSGLGSLADAVRNAP